MIIKISSVRTNKNISYKNILQEYIKYINITSRTRKYVHKVKKILKLSNL